MWKPMPKELNQAIEMFNDDPFVFTTPCVSDFGELDMPTTLEAHDLNGTQCVILPISQELTPADVLKAETRLQKLIASVIVGHNFREVDGEGLMWAYWAYQSHGKWGMVYQQRVYQPRVAILDDAKWFGEENAEHEWDYQIRNALWYSLKYARDQYISDHPRQIEPIKLCSKNRIIKGFKKPKSPLYKVPIKIRENEPNTSTGSRAHEQFRNA